MPPAAHGLPRAGPGVPARERIDVAEAERQIDRPAELGGIEAGSRAARLDLGDAARQQARAEPLPARRLGDQHHADPGDGRSERQRQRARDPLPVGAAHAEALPQRQHEAPVGGDLVPAGLDRQGAQAIGIVGCRRSIGQVGPSRRPRPQKRPSRTS